MQRVVAAGVGEDVIDVDPAGVVRVDRVAHFGVLAEVSGAAAAQVDDGEGSLEGVLRVADSVIAAVLRHGLPSGGEELERPFGAGEGAVGVADRGVVTAGAGAVQLGPRIGGLMSPFGAMA